MLLITTEFVCVLFGNRLQKERLVFIVDFVAAVVVAVFSCFLIWQVSFILRRQGGVSH